MKNKVKSFFLKNPAIKIKPRELAKKLSAREPHEYAKLKDVLFKLQQEEFLGKQGKRYFLKSASADQKLTGVIQILDDGNFAFVVVDNSDIKDVFIAERNIGNALNGDRVEIKLLQRKKGKSKEGEVINVIERKHSEIVGKLEKSNSSYFVIPDEKEIHRDIFIKKENLAKAEPGDKVVVTEIIWEKTKANPEGKISEVLGKAGSYEAEILSIARECNLRYEFPKKVISQANKIKDEIEQEEINKRLDLRNKILFTIDPEDAKDFDDAVSIDELDNGNYEIGIHIADVSHYVEENTPIYKEALKRGTSVYLVGNVIPMLPEKLSNNICSLVPGKDRLAFSVIVEMTPRARTVKYKIAKSVINSKRRFTYNEVQQILDNGKGEFRDRLIKLNEFANKLRKKRLRQGSINFHTPEVQFELDENGVPTSLKIKEIKESHQLVEDFMLLANQIIAKHVAGKKNKQFPFVYRVHDLPDEEKLNEFANFVKSLGYKFNIKSADDPTEFQRLLEQVEGTNEEALINEIAIRSMAKAVYSTDNIGHYGLGFDHYTHFTSPIRRFPDLIVHKLIYKYINKQESGISKEALEEICDHCSMQERNAVNAERLSVKLKQIEYLHDKIGEKFEAYISGITHFGIFVELSDNLAEGLIRLRNIHDDYYTFDEKHYSITGEQTGKKYRLGDKVNVKLTRVDEEKREIDFSLLN